MENGITLKYVTKFENNKFSYSNNFDLFNIIDLKQIHNLFKNNKYVTNVVIIEKITNGKTKLLYRLINGQTHESTITYLGQEIERTPYDITMESIFDINEIVTNIVNFIEVFDKEKSYNIISEIINDYEEEKKVKKLALF